MSAHSPKIPPVEQPQESADTSVELEQVTLEQQSKSAALRDVYVRDQLISALNRRIDVIQAKLDNREERIDELLPRNAALEQAGRSSTIETVLEFVAMGCSATFLSISTYVADSISKTGWFGAGIALAASAMLSKILFSYFGWPPKNR